MNAAETIAAAIRKLNTPDPTMTDDDIENMALSLVEPAHDFLVQMLGTKDIEQNWETLIYTQSAVAIAKSILGDSA